MYGTFKFLHILGVVLLLGNVTASAVWKVFANRTSDASIVAFAQKLVTYTDWAFTLGGAVLIAVGGYGMVLMAHQDLWSGWILWGQLLFVLSGVIWLARLIPIQIAQSRGAVRCANLQQIDEEYRALCRRWIAWGVAATVPIVAAMFLMVMKP